ncbi:hypothetical protein [Robbsia sp. KACC 23696]|uniref:hypothetical protein n=1 Tax=Robbsia sp. KACC 23696 TaxID=3149231 RepID=UPI00325B679D
MATQESTTQLQRKNDVASTATVVVASKLPMDLTARLYDFVKTHEPVMGGGTREVKLAQQRRDAKEFVFQGNSFPQNKGAHQQINFGYAITRDIPKAFWDEWLEQNKDADFIKNNLIFAHEQSGSLMAKARDHEEIMSGLERIDRNKLPRGVQESDQHRKPS